MIKDLNRRRPRSRHRLIRRPPRCRANTDATNALLRIKRHQAFDDPARPHHV
jgi:hypothetical protein